jgi:serine protease Do
LLAGISFAVAPLVAQDRTAGREDLLERFSASLESLSRRVTPSVVQVLALGLGRVEGEGGGLVRAQRGAGSGFVVDPEGYILTNRHVIQGASKIEVLVQPTAEEREGSRSVLEPAGRLVIARLVGADAETDLAVLKIDGVTLPALPMADSEALRQGQIVVAVGSPLGLRDSVTLGVVSATSRQLRPDSAMIYVQTDAPINPGNSGGPLVNTRGEVVGINTMIASQSGGSEGIGFAVPSNIARSVYEQIRKYGRMRRGQIGVAAQTITPLLAEALELDRATGVILSDVTPRGPAEAAGLQPGDIVLAMNGKRMENARQFRVNVYQQAAGSTVSVTVLRGGKTIEKQVAVLERESEMNRLDELIDEGGLALRRLGVFVIPLEGPAYGLFPNPRRLRGAVVAGRIPSLLIHNTGLETGDIIYSVNGKTVSNPQDLERQLREFQPGDPVALHIERGGVMVYLAFEAE